METIDLNINLTFGRKSVFLLLVLFFLCWRPGFIGSENLTLTTYYPAPYGGYVSILTTGQTQLARNAGSVLIGTGVAAAKFHVVGTSRMDGALAVNGAFTLVNGTQANNRVLTSNAVGLATWAAGGGPILCLWRNYNVGSTTACTSTTGTSVVMAARSGGMIRNLWAPPTSGQMFCCDIRP